MSSRRPNQLRPIIRKPRLAGLALALGAFSAGCGSDGAHVSHATGSVDLALKVGDSIELDIVHYEISGNGFSRSGDVPVGKSGELRLRVGGIPAGTGYLVTLRATGDDEVSCEGSQGFDVNRGRTTTAHVRLMCRLPGGSGSVLVTGEFNVCPAIEAVSVLPEETEIGGTVALTGFATDPDGGPSALSYSWSAESGGLSATHEPATDFVCTEAGDATVTLSVSDGDCEESVAVPVICSEPGEDEEGEVLLVWNEVESNGGTPDDWAELYNAGNASADLSHWVFKDNDDTHAYTLPAGTTIAPGEYLVLEAGDVGFGLGGADSVRLFDADMELVDSYTWSEHAPTTYARCPNGGGDFGTSTTPTKGEPNACSNGGSGLSPAMLDWGCRVLPNDGRLVCWGYGEYGGEFVDTRALPQGMETTWKSVSFGSTSCGITTEGDAYCWTSLEPPSPVDTSALPLGTKWSLLSVGGSTTCGIVTSSGAGYCWGSDINGTVGNGDPFEDEPSPSSIDGSMFAPEVSWSLLDVGTAHACGITSEAEALCWGTDANGRLGNGSTVTENQASPSRVDVAHVSGGMSWSTLSVGSAHTCAVTTTGTAYCWGSGRYGQLGKGDTEDAEQPAPVDITALPMGTTWAQISAGDRHSCGLTTAGAVYCWGSGTSGTLGHGLRENSQVPVTVDTSVLPAGTVWVSVAAGNRSSCGLTTQGAAYCWGPALYLGAGEDVESFVPRPELPVQNRIGILPDATELAGALNDPTNPALSFTLVPVETAVADIVVSAASSDESVIPVVNISGAGQGYERTYSFEPVGVGTATITFTVEDPAGNHNTLEIDYAVSGAAPHESGRYHHGIPEASTAIDVGDGYMVLGDDEVNILYLYKQDESGPPIKTWNLEEPLGGSELDVEGAARMGDQIVWVTSHGNARDGDIKERRRVVFATTITGSGAEVELEFSGRYGGGDEDKSTVARRGLWRDLNAWDETNGHGLGVDYLGFDEATREGVLPNAPNGFNIEGFEFGADGTTGYLAFRAPTVNIGGTQHALIVPVTNILDLVDGIGEQSGRGQFGAPIFLDLAGRSIRAIRRNQSFEYLISAGPPDNATVGVNDTWALYSWDGDSSHAPVLNQELPNPDMLIGGAWESIVSVPNPIASGTEIRLVADSGDATELYSLKSYSQLLTLQ